MNAPFFKFEYFNTDVSLIIAFAIGIAFGIALEKGGFGRATILASQFYFTNMRVSKSNVHCNCNRNAWIVFFISNWVC